MKCYCRPTLVLSQVPPETLAEHETRRNTYFNQHGVFPPDNVMSCSFRASHIAYEHPSGSGLFIYLFCTMHFNKMKSLKTLAEVREWLEQNTYLDELQREYVIARSH